MPSNVDPTLTPEVSGINAGKILSDKLRNVLSVIKSEFEAAEARDTTNLNAARTYADAKVAALLGSAPTLLDTLNELATALGNDPNFATTMTNALASKQSTNQKNQPNGYVGLGASGNLEGVNVIPRTGTTASLMTLTAPKGEIATALDATGKPTGIVQFGQIPQDNKFYKPLIINEIGAESMRLNIGAQQCGYMFNPAATAGARYYLGFYNQAADTTPNHNGGGTLLIQASDCSGTSNNAFGDSVNITGGAGRNGGDVVLSGGGKTGGAGQVNGGVYLGYYGSGIYVAGQDLSAEEPNVTHIGFYNRAIYDSSDPTLGAQPQPTNAVSGGSRVAVAGGNAVDDNDTFTGGIGTSGYTVGQVVRALKLLGLIAE